MRQLLKRCVPWMTHHEFFSEQPIGDGPWLDRGWKLHVSATPLSASAVLERALPILLASRVRFKVVGTRSRLLALNAGHGGRPQIGKFITIYPCDDTQAVCLALALDEATRGLRGPRIPSDRQLRPYSLVHFRYGAFRWESEPRMDSGSSTGTVSAVRSPEEGGFSDRRILSYVPPPAGIVDPFEAVGVHVAPPRRKGVFAQRYLVLGVLGGSYRGGVYRAVDLGTQPPRVCVLKEFWDAVGTDPFGREARAWGENEVAILARLSGDPVVPRLYDAFDLDGNLYITIEYLEGESLEETLRKPPDAATTGALDQLIVIGRATGEMLANLHEFGVVYGDFKPSNLIRMCDSRYRLIDFGIAYDYRSGIQPPLGCGTPPYASPERINGERPVPADDVFAWGAVLRRVAYCTQMQRNRAGDTQRAMPLNHQPLIELCHNLPPALAIVIDRATAAARRKRYANMPDALAAFEDAVCSIQTNEKRRVRQTSRH